MKNENEWNNKKTKKNPQHPLTLNNFVARHFIIHFIALAKNEKN